MVLIITFLQITLLILITAKKRITYLALIVNNYNKYDVNLKIDRVTANINDQLFFSQKNKDSASNESNNFKIGADFFLSKNQAIGFLMKRNLFDRSYNSYSQTGIGGSFQNRDSILRTPSYSTNNRKNFSYKLNYKGLLDTLGQELSIDADYFTYDGENNASYVNRFYLPDGNFLKEGLIYRNNAPSDIEIKAIKADYTLPVNKKLKLDAGVKIASVKSDNNYIYENNISGNRVFDNTKSNRFKYEEKVNAAYATLSANWGKVSIQAGLRAENTNSMGNSVTTGLMTEKKYTDLFPSLLLSKSFDDNHTLSFSYSRKINRPDYSSLNPFIFL